MSLARWYQAAIATGMPIPVAAVLALSGCSPSHDTPAVYQSASAPAPASLAHRVCGRPVLRSPFGYHGRPGVYTSGTPGLPTYGRSGSDFPDDTAGEVLPAQTMSYQNWQLAPHTVYYLEPGIHVGNFSADTGDAFVGGYAAHTGTTLSGNYGGYPWAIDSNSSLGDQPGVVIEYLTIEKYDPPVDQVAINQDGNTNWTIRYDTIELNVPGAGAFAATDSLLADNCLTQNGQYGFQSSAAIRNDKLTLGPYNITIEDNEISYNDTCDLSGVMNNAVVGWRNYDPVPVRYRNPHCGSVSGDGNQGGFKLWQTNGVTIRDNYIHNNWGPGGWADTNNANTTWTGNTITYNESAAIIEEISYNFSITGNFLAGNDWIDGLDNPSFPQPAIYISESGSDTTFGGVPGCSEASCSHQASFSSRSVISDNTLVDNGGSIFLWQNSNRACSQGSDAVCTLVAGGSSGPFTSSACAANLKSASANTLTYSGNLTGSPRKDWWDGCQWHTANVSVTRNVIDFNPANIPHCQHSSWPDCGAGGIFSQYGGPGDAAGWLVPSQLTFSQHDSWSGNIYNGPSTFYAWNQGNGDNPVSWPDWTGAIGRGDKCGSPSERQSGYCTGPFGQDSGSTYRRTPLRSNPLPPG